MDIRQLIFQVLYGAVSIYVLILYIRLFLGIFRFAPVGKLEYYTRKITEPYISIFRRLKFLQFSNLDLSLLTGLITATALQNVFFNLAKGLLLTIPGFFILFLQGFLSSVFFFIGFLGLLGLIRLIGIYLNTSSMSQFWYFLDQLIQPMVYWIMEKLSPRRELPYGTALIVYICTFAAVSVLGNLLLDLIPLGWIYIFS